MGRPPFLGGGRNFENVTVWAERRRKKSPSCQMEGWRKKVVRTGCVGVWGSNWDGRGKKTLSTIRPKFSTFRVIHRVGIELWEKMHFHSGVPPTIGTPGRQWQPGSVAIFPFLSFPIYYYYYLSVSCAVLLHNECGKEGGFATKQPI